MRDLLGRWQRGPIRTGVKPARPRLVGSTPVFHVRPWTDDDGDASRPDLIEGLEVIDRLRSRRDVPGCLVLVGAAAARSWAR